MKYDSWFTIVALAILVAGLPSLAHADGKTTYDNHCACCHGFEGRGDGPVAGALDPKPLDFQDPRYWRGLGPGGDLEIVRAIKKGGSARDHSTSMPAWEPVLTDDQVREIITYLRQLAGSAAFEESSEGDSGKPPAASPADPPADPPAKAPPEPAKTK